MENFKVTKEMLKSGKVLSTLIDMFKKENSEDNLQGILRCLRDSNVLVPLNVKLSPEDMDKVRNNVSGYVVKITDDINLSTDMIEGSDGEKYFPVFTQQSQIPDKYGINFSIIPAPFLTAIEMFETYDVRGIVIDAFTNSFILTKDLLSIVKSLPSEIESK